MTHRANLANFLAGDIYGITDAAHSLGRGNVETVRQMLAAGITVIQYREKDLSGREMYDECRAIRALTAEAGATFIVNDHVDLALAVGADGVHVGQDDLPAEEVRRLVGPDMIIGLSTHSQAQARAAGSLAGVIDYIGVGPIFATATKKDVSAPVGLEYLDFVAANIALPFVPIGGIKAHNIAEVRRRGAGIISLVSEIVGAADIAAQVAALRAILAATPA